MSRYYHTLRYLRPVQIGGRLWRLVYRPRPRPGPVPRVRDPRGLLLAGADRPASMSGPARFTFLNRTRELTDPADWNNPRWDRLWLYNLHYFDDLNAAGAVGRLEWHADLMSRWIDENPPGSGTGWEPYPTSLRIVNWIKWMIRNPDRIEERWLESLANQVRWLARRLEWHLLGNHLFVNAKALVHAGAYFSGDEADRWMHRGLDILGNQVPRQILADGGQFERSPMYHALAFEDVLDLINIAGAYPASIPESRCETVAAWRRLAVGMADWLGCLCHPDGEISFFNDTAMGIAPAPRLLTAYAARLGISRSGARVGLTVLPHSGYIRAEVGTAVALLDVAPIGPDYLPGHAHADTLSFELSVHGRRTLVNSGTSIYGAGSERHRQRGTPAHNTVVIDDENSSEVWAGFRVARRARPFGLEWREIDGACFVKCSHDGYRRLRGRPVHTRSWNLSASSLQVVDDVSGSFDKAVARFHVHPEFAVESISEGELLIRGTDRGGIRVTVQDASVRVLDSTYHPGFGISLRNRCIEVRMASGHCRTEFHWS